MVPLPPLLTTSLLTIRSRPLKPLDNNSLMINILRIPNGSWGLYRRFVGPVYRYRLYGVIIAVVVLLPGKKMGINNNK